MKLKFIVKVSQAGEFVSQVGCETQTQVDSYSAQMKMLYGSAVKIEVKNVGADTRS